MVKLTNEYVAFGALMIITATGLALVVVGACLLSWAGYLSPWAPTWIWVNLAGLSLLGVMIAASSAVCAIATVAPKPKSAHRLLVLLLIFLGLELFLCSLSVQRQRIWSINLYKDVQTNMHESQLVYGTNASSAAMWDEIQNEMSCCGVLDYSDWFISTYSNGNSVPDSCCLLPNSGCGTDVRNLIDIDDHIDTQGCLPVLSAGWMRTYHLLTMQALLPICIAQIVMMTIILLTLRRAGMMDGHLPIRVSRPEIGDNTAKYATMA